MQGSQSRFFRFRKLHADTYIEKNRCVITWTMPLHTCLKRTFLKLFLQLSKLNGY
jgi:hypothetical protein